MSDRKLKLSQFEAAAHSLEIPDSKWCIGATDFVPHGKFKWLNSLKQFEHSLKVSL